MPADPATRDGDDFTRALARHGRSAPGDDITRHIPADTKQRLRGALHHKGIGLASMAHQRGYLVERVV
ncbi:hypothetical protein ACFPOU_13255 [Massilia jejuensis]|uniref:Uncharacterized protein n=1 Tax=Massilia jejuensis TaxID=648894 RepID=A0ABW0PIA6_9BURK